MSGHKVRPGANRADIGAYVHISGETITLTGTSVVLTIPSDASVVFIVAENGAVYYATNGAIASAISGGYIPEDTGQIIGPLANLQRMAVFGAADVKAHIQYLWIGG
jgi:hypothetical protein